jgi:hypothetical protein
VDALLAVLVPILPQLGGGSLLFAFAVWRERAHNAAAKQWAEERAALIAERVAAVAAERAAHAEDDARKDKRIAALVAENEALEKALDDERRVRRNAEDGARTQRLPVYRPDQEGSQT